MTSAIVLVRVGLMPQIGLPWQIPAAQVAAERDEASFVNVCNRHVRKGQGRGAYLTEARESVVILSCDLRDGLS